MQIHLSIDGSAFKQCSIQSIDELRHLLPQHIIWLNGKPIGKHNASDLSHGCRIRAQAPLPGGKGGFGSLLRAFGKQILISNNKEACRDLNGRRMRDVNNEKKLKEWLLNQAERKRAKEEEKLKRLERKRQATPKHYFSDLKYKRQKETIHREVDNAVDDAFRLLKEKSESAKVTSERDAALRMMGIPEEIESDEEDEEVICISQELYNQIMAEEESISNHLNGTNAESGDSGVSEGSGIENKTREEINESKKPEPSWPPVELEDLHSLQSCVDLGADRLKYELSRRGLKCGGTLTERAERLWSVRGLTTYPKNLLAKPMSRKSKACMRV